MVVGMLRFVSYVYVNTLVNASQTRTRFLIGVTLAREENMTTTQSTNAR